MAAETYSFPTALKERSIRMIAFDLDGTLAETDDYYVNKADNTLGKFLFFIPMRSRHVLIRKTVMGVETFLNAILWLFNFLHIAPVVETILTKLEKHHSSYKYDAVAGSIPVLRELSKHYKLAMITLGSAESADGYIHKFGLEDIFTVIITSRTCRKNKPSPFPLQYAAENAGVSVSECLMIGDTFTDVICARRAGAASAAVRSGFDSEGWLRLFKPDAILDSVSDLPDFLQAVFPNTTSAHE